MSLTLADRHKFLQSPNVPRAINLDASNPAMANGSTFIILNQPPVAHCTVPSTSVLVSQQNIAVLHSENTVTSQHVPAAAPSSKLTSQLQETLYNSSRTIPTNISFAQPAPQTSSASYSNMATECTTNGPVERLDPVVASAPINNGFLDKRHGYDSNNLTHFATEPSTDYPHLESLAQTDYGE